MKQFFRNFRKQKTVGILNICGLSFGIMVSLVVGLWAINELSFDGFHKDADKMYRLVQVYEMNNKPVRAASAFEPVGKIAEAEIPQIEQMCRIYKENDGITMNEVVQFGLTSILTDYNFFSFFTFPLKEGDPKTAFASPDNVIITESTAKKYYPNENPIGKKVSYHGYDLSISGIMYDMPHNSHIQADIVFPFFGYFKDWGWTSSFSYDTYFKISNADAIPSVEKKLAEIIKIGMTGFLTDTRLDIELEPIKDVHFSKTDAGFDSAVKGNKQLLNIFIIIAIAILIIACINFTNLFISTSFIRAKSIGIKKSLGASKGALILDFYKETSIYVLISVIGGVLLSLLILPFFNSFTRSSVTIDFTSPQLYIFVVCLTIVTILMAGSFPAIQMTRFGIIETLRSKFKGKRMSIFQKVLIVIQFTTSISLLIVVFFFARQVEHILSQDLGFDNKNVIYMNGWREFGSNYKTMREEFIQEPSIQDVAMRQYDLPLKIGNGVAGKHAETGEIIMLDLSEVSPNYFEFFDMKFIAGENPLFLESAPQLRYCVLNKRAADALGLGDDPVDKTFTFVSIGGSRPELNEQKLVVKGVIADTYVKSLHQEPDPEMYLNLSRDDHNPIFFKVAGNPQKAISVIEKRWKEMVPDTPFEYHFLDKTYEAQYTAEINSRNVLSFALVITFLITVAGLYAMVFYSTQRRVKEIGIRKINGATIAELLLLLNKDILIWVLISFVIACPIAYFYLNNWLESFAVKAPLSWWIFLLAGCLTSVVALLTVSYQTWRAANANPVDSIKNE